MKFSILWLAAWPVAAAADDFTLPNSKAYPLRLWYNTTTTVWNDSLPIGNGRLGGMIRGAAASELIALNEDSLWSGGKMDRLNQDGLSTLKTVQSMLFQGQVTDATLEAALGLIGTPTSMREYIPVGDLQIIHQDLGTINNFERWLDLSDATSGVYFSSNNITYKREYLVSEPTGILAIRVTASKPASLNFYVRFDRPAGGQNRFAEVSYGQGGDSIYSDISSGIIDAVTGVRVNTVGGTKRQIGDNIQVMRADEVWIYSDTETSVRYGDPKGEVQKKLDAAMASTYQQLRDRHVQDYQQFFGRASLDLGKSSTAQTELSTDKRRQNLQSGGFDPELTVLYYQFGRYLLIASSRVGTLPPNLQGIWNNNRDPPWGSKYTININLQMNYWPSEVTNLGDLTPPLFDLIETAYTTGKDTARRMYNASGWCIHHNTDIWGDTAPQDIWAPGTYWPMGGVWLISHIYEHYLYTQDQAILKKYYYLFYESASFFADYLSDYKGWKVTSPSSSPENSYKNGSVTGAVTFGPTMDNSLLRELFDNLLTMTDLLGKPHDDLIDRTKELRAKLPPLRVSERTGRLLEWIEDFNETEPGHRHMSHVYGLYPGSEITQANKTIQDAAKAAVDWRVSNGGGSTGWSRAWIISLYARLSDGPSVEHHIQEQLYNYTYNSLLDTGPPAGFQIDGNLGATAGIAEALLQSHDGLVSILPAAPPSSKDGSFAGLVARGGFVVDAAWRGGRFVNATVESRCGGQLNVTVGTGQMISVQGGQEKASRLSVKTTKGGKYVLVAAS